MLGKIVFFSFVALASGMAAPFRICPGPRSIKSIDLDRCTHTTVISGVPSCVVKKANKVTATLLFIPPLDAFRAIGKVTAMFNGNSIPGLSLTVDLCQHSVPPCPMKRGESYILRYTLPMVSFLPDGIYELTGYILDENGRQLGCAKGQVLLTRL